MRAQLLQKYIAYARTYVSPVLSDEAAGVLRDFYLQLRRQATMIDGAPVTVRPAPPFDAPSLCPGSLNPHLSPRSTFAPLSGILHMQCVAK